MFLNLVPIYFGAMMSIIDIVMETLCKYYTIAPSRNILVLVMACAVYAFQPYIFSKSLKYDGMGTVNVVWNVISTCLIIIIGVFLFGEKLNSFQWSGVVLSILALVLLSIKSDLTENSN